MFSILNRALSCAITSFGNKFCLKKRTRLIKALDNRFYVKFMQLEICLFIPELSLFENLDGGGYFFVDTSQGKIFRNCLCVLTLQPY